MKTAQLSLEYEPPAQWLSAFDFPQPPMCQCPACWCRDEAEDGRRCALCAYGVHVWEKPLNERLSNA
jgi:hypothetical protein